MFLQGNFIAKLPGAAVLTSNLDLDLYKFGIKLQDCLLVPGFDAVDK
jgi:hypothetical protein